MMPLTGSFNLNLSCQCQSRSEYWVGLGYGQSRGQALVSEAAAEYAALDPGRDSESIMAAFFT